MYIYKYKYIYKYIHYYIILLGKNINSKIILGIFLHIPPSISKLSSVICHCS